MDRAPTTKVHYVHDFREVRLPDPAVVICDRKLKTTVGRSFPGALFVSAGEGLKSLEVIGKLAEETLKRCSDRSLTLVAVGGVSVGDAVGFLASVLWRGVGLVQIPTTLLAMVDSAHGGKTAVNLVSAKNQLGTFFPARDVWIVESLLSGFAPPMVDDGLAEIFKAALLGDPVLAREFLRKGVRSVSLRDAIRSAIRVKQRIVARDPLETRGVREVLNLGHTMGHALELTAHLSHGRAVAWGLACAATVSARFGFAQRHEVLAAIRPLLVPPKVWPQNRVLLKALAYDKKRKDRRFRSVVLRKIAVPWVTDEVTPGQWLKALESVRGGLRV